MQKIKQTIRYACIFTVLCSIGAAGTKALLPLHLHAHAGEHCHGTDHDSHHEEPLCPHQHDHCGICQVLLGPAGKYISIQWDDCPQTDAPVLHSVTFASQFFLQYTFSRVIPRAPPVV